jgi:hypothetical protein
MASLPVHLWPATGSSSFPFRDTPTLIWIKEKEGIFCTGEPRRVFQSLDMGPVAKNLTMPEAILPPAAMPAPHRRYNWLHQRERHKNPMPPSQFLIEAFDREQWCPVLQASFPVDDLQALHTILAGIADDDPDLEQTYLLDDEELAAVVASFNVSFDAAQLDSKDLQISLSRSWSSDRTPYLPYLSHTGYELPLLPGGLPNSTASSEDRSKLSLGATVPQRSSRNSLAVRLNPTAGRSY